MNTANESRLEQAAATSHNSSKNDAPSFDRAQLRLRKENIVVAPFVLPRVGMRLRAQEMSLLVAPFGASFSSGKTNGVFAADVMRHHAA